MSSIVQGHVRDAFGRPLTAKVVRAFDKDLRHEEFLGEAPTDANGTYEISYSVESYQTAEAGGADLLVRAYEPGADYPGDPNDLTELVASDVFFNAPEDQIVDLVVGGGKFAGESEYELVAAAVTPVLDGATPTELTEDDAEFLSKETGRDLDQIDAYRHSARLVDEAAAVSPDDQSLTVLTYDSATTYTISVTDDSGTTNYSASAAGNVDATAAALAAEIAAGSQAVTAEAAGAKVQISAEPRGSTYSCTGSTDGGNGTMDGTPSAFYLPAEVFYAFLRSDFPTEFSQIFENEVPRLIGVLDTAIQDNLVPAWLNEAQTRSNIDTRIEEHAYHERCKSGAPLSTLMGDLVAAQYSTLGSADALTVLETQMSHSGTEEAFYEALATAGLSDAKVIEVKAAVSLSQLALGHNPIVLRLHGDIWDAATNTPHPERAAEKTLEQWLDIIKGENGETARGFPTGVPGETQADQEQNYAQHLYQAAEITYPTTRIASRIQTELPGPGDPDPEQILRAFFEDTQTSGSFRFEETNVQDFYAEHSGQMSEELVEELEERQRIFRLVPAVGRLDAMRVFKAAQISSAQSIAAMGYGSFMKRFAEQLGGQGAANQVWCEAMDRTIAAQMWTMSRVEDIAGIEVSGAFKTNKSSSTEQANWREMFGPLDFCQCEHCKSVHGPASYLADLLGWLEEVPPSGGNPSPVAVLFARRPELPELLLSCANTNTVLPYIDLANEVMENAVAPRSDYSVLQTTKTAEELAALPEHLSTTTAYSELKKAPYPWRLPFDISREEAWPILAHLGFSRPEWRRVLRHYSGDAEDAAALDQLGINEIERKIILGLDLSGDLDLGTPPLTDGGEDVLWGLGGNPTWWDTDQPPMPGLRTVETFLEQATFEGPGTRLDFTTLKQLLATRLVRDPQGAYGLQNFGGLKISFDTSEPCALSKAKLEGISTTHTPQSTDWKKYFNLMRRFLRLRHKLGWSVMELDKALTALDSDLDDPLLLTDLAHVEQLRALLDVPLLELLSWWGNIDTAEDKSEDEDAKKVLSHYEQVLLSPPQKTDTPFALNAARTDLLDPSPTVASKAITVAGALRVSASDLTLLLSHLSGTPAMSLATLSRLYRLASMASRLELTVRQLLSCIRLMGTDPSLSGVTPQSTIRFVQRVQAIQASAFSVEELDYLLQHHYREQDGVAPLPSAIAEVLTDLQSALASVQSGADATETLKKKQQLVSQKLATKLSLASDTTEILLGSVLLGKVPASGSVLLDLVQVEDGGLWASYFDNDTLSGTPALTRIDSPVDQTWSSPPSPISGSIFSVRWEGMLRATKSGTYKLDVLSDTGTTRDLWLGGQKLILNTGEVQLRAGVCYELRVDLAKTSIYPSSVDLKWWGPDATTWAAIPAKQLIPSVLLATYEAAHKAGLVASRLKLGAADIKYLATNKDDFKGLVETAPTGFDLDALPCSADDPAAPLEPLEQVRDVWSFASSCPNTKVRIINVLSAAQQGLAEARSQLLVLTAWDSRQADRLCNWDATSPVTLVNLLRAAYEGHRADVTCHTAADNANIVTLGEASDLPTALSLASQIKAKYEAHRVALGDVHEHADGSNAVTAADATDLVSLVNLVDELMTAINAHCGAMSTLREAITLLNELKADYEAHRVLTTGAIHGAEDNTNFVAAPDAVDLDSAQTLANDLKDQYELHRVLTTGGVHAGEDQTNIINVEDAEDLGTLAALANKLKEKYEAHRVLQPAVHGQEDNANSVTSNNVGTADIHRFEDTTHTIVSPIAPDSLSDALAVTQTDLKQGRKLAELHQCMTQMQRMGFKADQLVEWSTAPVDTDLAASVREAARAKYGPDKWLAVAGPLRNDLRRKQRDALGAYLVHDKSLETINDLYGELLIDAGMEPCMKTSRLKLALSSVQLFVHRCLMNLEPQVELTETHEKEWRWRRNYRVWEANRKVFLFPENWIEPELRDDKTPFFKELESELLEGEITSDAAEDAYRHYLEKLADVSRLEMVGGCEEVLLTEKYLHIFGRTRGTPHVYYYRRCIVDLSSDRAAEWTPWERVDLDISSDHLLPVMWNRRLHLFWPVFEEEVQGQTVGSTTTTVSNLKLKIAWSRYKDTTWSPTSTTESYVLSSYGNPNQSTLAFASKLDSTKKVLTITCYGPQNQTILVTVTPVPLVKFEFKGGPQGAGKATAAAGLSMTTPYLYWRRGQHLLPVGTGVPLWDCHPILTLPDDKHYVAVLQQVPEDMKRFPTRTCFFQDSERSFLALARSWLLGTAVSDVKLMAVHFQIFDLYHPHVDDLYGDLNQYGVEGLLDPAFQTAPYKRRKQLAFLAPSETWFKNTYQANSTYLVGDLPIENIDFEETGAFSTYNWELFFHIPLLIAERLKQNQRFAEAMRWYHYVFDPTYQPEDPATEPAPQRYWRMRHLAEVEPESLNDTLVKLSEGDDTLRRCVAKWRKYPFKPHLVARYRTVSYMKNVVMKYLDNLIAWGDYLFSQDSIESINEATQLYIMAAQILGQRPAAMPPREHVPKTYSQLKATGSGLGPLSNVLIKAEQAMSWKQTSILVDTATVAPITAAEVSSSSSWSSVGPLPFPLVTTGSYEVAESVKATDDRPLDGYYQMAGSGTPDLPGSFYFCIPHNEALLSYWDTVADRLFKIRNCMNIKGVVRTLPLFQPPIDPALLVKAAAAGLDLSTVLADSSASLPGYRFSVLVQKAQALCNEVKGFGGALLSALEKRDSEGLSLLTSGHRVTLLEAVTEVRKKQVDEARAALEAANCQKTMLEQRKSYYQSLVDTGLIAAEEDHLSHLNASEEKEESARDYALASSIVHLLPDMNIGEWPPMFSVTVGGTLGGNALRAASEFYHAKAAALSYKANMSDLTARHERRKQEWKQQVTQAEKELSQVEKQILAAELRLAIAEQEKKNHATELSNTQEQDRYLRSKFTDKELYGWMVSQLSGLYFQSYKLAYDLARKAERTFEHELGKKSGTAGCIQFGYWDSLKKGLLAGEKLGFDLSRMEAAYLEDNAREYELTKNISLAQLNPVALVKLRETGSCYVHLPEVIFDLDYPTHYMRRIKSVDLTIPCVAGPLATVACTLTLQSSKVRRTATDAADNEYAWVTPTKAAIATSNAQGDCGLFELSFKDERYLPFEGAGTESHWQLKLSDLRTFNSRTISDVVMQIRYTSRDGRTPTSGGGTAPTSAEILQALGSMSVDNPSNPSVTGLLHFVSIRHGFPSSWNVFLYPPQSQSGQTASFSLTKQMVPLPLGEQSSLPVDKVEVLLKVDGLSSSVPATLKWTDNANPPSTKTEYLTLAVGTASDYGSGVVHHQGNWTTSKPLISGTWSVEFTEATLNALHTSQPSLIDEIDGSTHRFKASLVEDIFVIIHYKSS